MVEEFLSAFAVGPRDVYGQRVWRLPRVASLAQLGELLAHESLVEVWGHGLFLSVGVM